MCFRLICFLEILSWSLFSMHQNIINQTDSEWLVRRVGLVLLAGVEPRFFICHFCHFACCHAIYRCRFVAWMTECFLTVVTPLCCPLITCSYATTIVSRMPPSSGNAGPSACTRVCSIVFIPGAVQAPGTVRDAF